MKLHPARRARRDRKLHAWLVCLLVICGGSEVPAALAQTGTSSATEAGIQAETEAETETVASGTKVTIHGFLSQAYAQSDGHQFLGITEDGVSDYRTAAVQVRADITAKDTFVIQLNHERIGRSPAQALKDDVEVDWLFYEHRFGDSAIKVGRIQIPFGIYNEVLDVGTLLPFYRPSHNFYGEAAYSSETVDGLVLSHSLTFGDGWGLDADLHLGSWEFTERNGNEFTIDEVDDSVGVEVWLDTPISGLRAGVGGMHYEITSPLTGGESTWKAYHASVTGDFDRFVVNAEAKRTDIGLGIVTFGYLHLGVKVTEKLMVNGQIDRFYFELSDGGPRVRTDNDLALGVFYAFRPDLVAKAEHHWNEGRFWLEDVPAFGGPDLETQYSIVSLSSSF